MTERCRSGAWTVRNLAVLALLLAGGAPQTARAEAEGEELFEDEFELLAEEDIVFSAAKHKQVVTESPSAVTVITRAQIENTHCTDVICLLRMVPEVTVRRIAPMYASVGARALTSCTGNKVLLIVDGQEINIEYFGLPHWLGLPVHLEDIERIEVIRGPASALYGPNAHSMVVVITTRRATGDQAEAFVSGGEHDRNGVHLQLATRIGAWGLQVAGGYETAGHWRLQDIRQRELGRMRLRFDHQGDDSESVFEIGLVTPDGAGYTAMAPVATRDSRMAHLTACHRNGPLRLQLAARLMSMTFTADLPFVYQGIKMGELPPALDFLSGTVDVAPQLNLELFAGNLLLVGGNYRWIGFHSNANDPTELHEHRMGLFVQDEQRLGDDLVLTGGVRFDYNNLTPFTVSPRLAGVWRFLPGQHLRLAFGQAFSRPAFFNTHVHYRNVQAEPGFEELEEFFRSAFGNPDLGNEKLTSFEGGYRGRFFDERLAIDLDVFFLMHRNTISFFWEIGTNELGMPDLGDSIIEYRNGGRKVNTLGGSASVTYRPTDTLRLDLNATCRSSWFISRPTSTIDLAGGKGDRVGWEPVLLVNARASYAASMGLRLGLAVHFSSSYSETGPAKGGVFDPLVEQRMPAVVIASGYLAWRLPCNGHDLELGVRAFNVCNARFAEAEHIVRDDGAVIGGNLLARRVLLFLRAAY